MNAKLEIPVGYRQDGNGRLIPEAMIKPIDLTRDELVIELVNQAKATNDVLREFKLGAAADIEAFIDLSLEQYQTKVGGKKGNITLFSFDGKFKIQIAISERIAFDERLQAAKSLIDECITRWAQGSSPEIKTLVQDAFQTNKEGKISTGRVLALRRLDISDDKWQMAMKAIGESVQVEGSKEYIRFYERASNTDKYESINLDFASV
jgi:hypothetical protein